MGFFLQNRESAPACLSQEIASPDDASSKSGNWLGWATSLLCSTGDEELRLKRVMMTAAALALIGVGCLIGARVCSDETVPLAQRPAREKIGPATLGWFSPAGDVFRRLGAPEQTRLASSVETVGPDGPMPEIISGSLESLAPATAIMEHYRAACLRLGLDSPPSAEILRVQPELTCHGSYGGETIDVIVIPQCEGNRCLILVKVRG